MSYSFVAVGLLLTEPQVIGPGKMVLTAAGGPAGEEEGGPPLSEVAASHLLSQGRLVLAAKVMSPPFSLFIFV